jgi:hypothetical protein
MTFTKRLREGVRRGEITCSVRIWTRPNVIAGNRYRMEEGEIEIDSIDLIGFPDITPQLARASGFLGSSICSKSPNMAAAKTSTSSASTTSHPPAPKPSARHPRQTHSDGLGLSRPLVRRWSP